jgi:hypothetical protein
VLRPVGPRGRRVYWVRRAVLLGVIAIVIIVVAAECSGGGGGGGGGHNHNAGGGPQTLTPTTTKPTVAACDPTSLKLTLSTDTANYTPGQSPRLIASFANQSSTTCKLARSAANEIWTIKSGSPTVWTTQGCPPESKVPKHLKLPAGATKTIDLFWNGHLRTSSCVEGAVAQPGTYTFDANLDGVEGNTVVFHIQSPSGGN